MPHAITIYERHFAQWDFEPDAFKTLADVQAWLDGEIAGLRKAIASTSNPSHLEDWQKDLDQVLQAKGELDEIVSSYGPKARLDQPAK